MERKIIAFLCQWKDKPGRMPLLVYGARQVGKTYILREFGKRYYRNVAYFNLELNQRVSSYFAENIEPARILRFLETESGERILPGETLIFLDEIQSCPRTLTALKYFREQMPEYVIVCAGSLLGVAVNREQYSFPVGNVDSVTLFPLDFEEFLWAFSEERLCDEIKAAFEINEALPAALHEKAMDYYRQYLIVGGMPRAVLEYMQTGSFITVPELQNRILNDYLADMSKYADPIESVKIRAAYDSIPAQLAKENKKFQYKLAQKGGTANLFGVAIEWLQYAGVVLRCERLEHGFLPVSVYRDIASFKLYMGDIGLLTMKTGVPPSLILSAGTAENTFIGALTENYVAQSLACKRYGLYYWTNEGTAEVDFVLQKDVSIIPIEVKTGTRVKSRSLTIFNTKYKPAYAIRVSAKNFGFENGIKSVPLYAVFCI
jgi:predicted AAA+ superfamily ATPase